MAQSYPMPTPSQARWRRLALAIIVFLFYPAWRHLEDPAILVLPALAGLLVGAADESLQWFIPNRVGEIADIFLNGIAIGCGLLFSLGADPPVKFQARLHPGSGARIGRLTAATVLGLALFFHVVHLGYDIHDQEMGTFKSRYPGPALDTLTAARLETWRTHPPLVLQRVSREDQYMTEGVTHVQERNELLSANDPSGAWQENRILEKYYAPVLDTPSYVSRTGHRWSAEQRADEAARAPRPDAAYVSKANPYPIYAWSRTAFWSGAIGVAALLWFVCTRLVRFGKTRSVCRVSGPREADYGRCVAARRRDRLCCMRQAATATNRTPQPSTKTFSPSM